MRIVAGLIATLVLSTSMAASTKTQTTSESTSTSTVANYWNKLKESPVSLNYLNENYVAVYGQRGHKTYHYLYLGYKFNPKYSVKLVSTITSDYTGNSTTKGQRAQGDVHTEYQSNQLRLYRSGILTEKEHGVNLNVQVRNYFYNDNTRNEDNIDTKHRVYPSLSKSWGKLSASLLLFTEFYSGKTDKKRNDFIAPGFSYEINDTFSIGASMEYYSKNHDSSTKDTENYYLNLPEVSINALGGSIGLSAAFKPAVSKDKYEGFVNKWWKKGSIVASYYASVF